MKKYMHFISDSIFLISLDPSQLYIINCTYLAARNIVHMRLSLKLFNPNCG